MVITLIGYRGTGKSTVATELARRLGWDSVDADAVIEQRAGRTIREIFDVGGEAEFRRLERDVMQELLRGSRMVIATGGGAILDEQTRQKLPTAGPSVWLRASIDTILDRLAADRLTGERRPNLTASGGRTEVEGLLAARTPLYRACADIAVDTDGRTVTAIAEEIIGSLASALPRPAREGASG